MPLRPKDMMKSLPARLRRNDRNPKVVPGSQQEQEIAPVVTTVSAAKKAALRVASEAFVEAMRCSLDEAESKTSVEDRTDCIDVGKLLLAMKRLTECLEVFGGHRGPNDIRFHCDRVELLYKATPVDQRDWLSGLMSSQPSAAESLVRALTMKSLSRKGSLIASAEESSGSKPPPSEDLDRDRDRDPADPMGIQQPPGTTASPLATAESPDSAPPAPGTPPDVAPAELLPQLHRNDHENGKQSMFWLCYYVRYLYNFHRLVLKGGLDPVDASTMSFMQYLHKYFRTYYEGSGDAKSFLNVVAEYRSEHFLDRMGHDGWSSSPGLNSFLSTLEVVMYLWTPAFKEMVLKGELVKQ